VIGGAAVSFCADVLARLSPDSARTKNTMANMIAIQKTGRTAFDLFILVTPLLRASVPCLLISNRRRRSSVQRQ
jgi:hypothetical protein